MRPEVSSEKTEPKYAVRTVTPGFDDDVAYLERVHVTDRAEAAKLIKEYSGFGPDEEVDPQPIHMRWITEWDEETEGQSVLLVPEIPCWLECPADHPDAVPFWKDAP